MRPAVPLALSIIFIGCMRGPTSRAEPQLWQRVASPSECIFDEVPRNLPKGVPIALDQSFNAGLMAQIAEQPVREPLCWYEVSTSELLLRTGGCDSAVAANWSLARIEVFSCHKPVSG
jgi:hypothetical protein